MGAFLQRTFSGDIPRARDRRVDEPQSLPSRTEFSENEVGSLYCITLHSRNVPGKWQKMLLYFAD